MLGDWVPQVQPVASGRQGSLPVRSTVGPFSEQEGPVTDRTSSSA